MRSRSHRRDRPLAARGAPTACGRKTRSLGYAQLQVLLIACARSIGAPLPGLWGRKLSTGMRKRLLHILLCAGLLAAAALTAFTLPASAELRTVLVKLPSGEVVHDHGGRAAGHPQRGDRQLRKLPGVIVPPGTPVTPAGHHARSPTPAPTRRPSRPPSPAREPSSRGGGEKKPSSPGPSAARPTTRRKAASLSLEVERRKKRSRARRACVMATARRRRRIRGSWMRCRGRRSRLGCRIS